MKKFIAALLFVSTTATANPYIEYKRTEKLHEAPKEYLRAGYKAKNNTYLEIGDSSWEAGYKVKFKKFLVKGKLEHTDGKNKLETEIRYTFEK